MPKKCWMLSCCLFAWLGFGAASIHAQVTRADYERAAQLRDKYKGLALNIVESPSWVEDTDTFWYRKTVEGGHAFVLVDANTKIKKTAFDHDKLAAALSEADGEKYTGVTLPFARFRYVDKQVAIEFVLKNHRWHCDLINYACTKPEPLRADDQEYESDDDYDNTPRAINNDTRAEASPDGKLEAFVENYNVFVREKGKADKTALSTDGSEDNYYAYGTLVWSPDSRHLVAYRIRPGYKREVHYVESSPADQLQPKYSMMVYPKAGDVLALPQPVLFDVPSKHEIPIANSLFPNPFELSPAVWWKDSRGFTFEYNQRGHQDYRVIEVDAASGVPRVLIDEESKTFVDYRPLVPDQFDTTAKRSCGPQNGADGSICISMTARQERSRIRSRKAIGWCVMSITSIPRSE
ncbi:DPP IV N-terminal domain-containing protein [Alloacidobacterium dinghuense]|uniref:DPP IV N-terminal domain-containing protein n=1 Tax=Alloacidobacterium dinghuense TaxID=2763107 RepID=UPI0020368C03|nr:DPP IV N-terminal domain-containing protein [Alloacidobacterium dinghuense]